MNYSRITLAIAISVIVIATSGRPQVLLSQDFVEYPNQNRTYGDHTLNSSWAGGPTGVSVTFDGDDVTMHEDGNGFSQRTSRNTQTFVAPLDATNPQNYDSLFVVSRYGSRLPLIQQMSANSSSVLTYEFDVPLSSMVDLFITDVDSSDAVSVSAYDSANQLLDMREWNLLAEGDLSSFKDTGTVFSEVIAPTPITVFERDFVSFTAANSTNYNRSYSILRSPSDVGLSRIEISFAGTSNSPSRERPNTGSHIYTALSTAVLAGDFNDDGIVDVSDIDFYLGNIGQPAAFDPQLDLNADGVIGADDLTFHIQNFAQTSNGQTGTLVGDMDLDGVVDVLGDAATLVNNLNRAGPYSYGTGDLNGDQAVDVLGDAVLLVNNLGKSNSPPLNGVAAKAVPEPSGWMVIWLTGIAVSMARRDGGQRLS